MFYGDNDISCQLWNKKGVDAGQSSQGLLRLAVQCGVQLALQLFSDSCR